MLDAAELIGRVQGSASQPADSRRCAWIAGATGRLGDALLEQVLASGRYRRVSVLAPQAMATTVTGFEAVDQTTLRQRLQQGEALGFWPDDPAHPAHCDDLYLLLDPDAEAELAVAAKAAARSRSGKPAFEPLSDSELALTLADLAQAAGAQRLLLMAPLQSWHQLSRATRSLPDGLELKLAAVRIPLVVIMKPAAEPASRPIAAAEAASWPQRLHQRLQTFSRFYLRQLRFMLPVSTVVIRSVDLARIAVERLGQVNDAGLQIIGIETIEALLRQKRGLRPRQSERPNGWRPLR